VARGGRRLEISLLTLFAREDAPERKLEDVHALLDAAITALTEVAHG
jgi:hypothetical protein